MAAYYRQRGRFNNQLQRFEDTLLSKLNGYKVNPNTPKGFKDSVLVKLARCRKALAELERIYWPEITPNDETFIE